MVVTAPTSATSSARPLASTRPRAAAAAASPAPPTPRATSSPTCSPRRRTTTCCCSPTRAASTTRRCSSCPRARAPQGPGVRQRARSPGRRAGRRDAAVQGVRRGHVRVLRDPVGHGQEDRAGRVRERPRRAASRRSRSTTATAWSACASPRADDVLLPRARATRSGSPRTTCARWAATPRRPRHHAARGRSRRRHGRHSARRAGDADHRVRARLRQAHRPSTTRSRTAAARASSRSRRPRATARSRRCASSPTRTT